MTPSTELTQRQHDIIDFIERTVNERGYPPSVREIGTAVGLTSPSTVHSHLATLQRLGYLKRDPTKPRAIEVRYDPNSGAAVEKRPVRHVPLVGDVAAGTDVLAQENVEELLPLPVDFCGEGDLFMLRVRGESMINAGILDGDYVVAHAQTVADKGDIVVAGHPRRGGHGEDLQPQGQQGRARSGERRARAHELRRVRGIGVRAGRERAPQAVSESSVPGRLTAVTLGCRDLPAQRRFYRDLGFVEAPASSDDWVAFHLAGVYLCLYGLDALTAEAAPGSPAPAPGWNGVTLAINVASPEEVDVVYTAAVAAGSGSPRSPDRSSLRPARQLRRRSRGQPLGDRVRARHHHRRAGLLRGLGEG